MKSADTRLQAAVGKWLPNLNQIQGWQEWKREMIGQTLWFDDPWPIDKNDIGDFKFPVESDTQHAVVMSYYALHSTLTSLRDCEYYFRRYPFAGLPIHKHDHLRYVCEMYFSRFYEFRARIKECFKAINATHPAQGVLSPGPLIKAYDKEFDREIRARNGVHHHNRFEDIAIDNLLLLTMSSQDAPSGNAWKRRSDAAYRRSSKEWAMRVVKRSKAVEAFLDAIAEAILLNCPFLGDLTEPIEGDERMTVEPR